MTDRPATDRLTTNDRPLNFKKLRIAISLKGIIQFTPCLVTGGVFGVGGSNGAISGLTKFNRYLGENNE